MSFNNTAIAHRYAKAIFDVAEKTKNIEKYAQNFVSLAQIITDSKEFRDFITNPVLDKKKKANIFASIFKNIASSKKEDVDFVNFIKLVANNGRIDILDKIIDSYLDLVSQYSGEISALVVSAVELKKAQLDQLTKVISESLKKKVKLDTKVDPSILGGLILKIGSKMFDSSLSGKIRKIEYLSKHAIASNL